MIFTQILTVLLFWASFIILLIKNHHNYLINFTNNYVFILKIKLYIFKYK